jgi:oxidase EvaA
MIYKIEDLHFWFSNLIEKSDFQTDWIPLSQSYFWSLRSGKIVHKSGHFFKVIGVQFKNSKGKLIEQPLIDQREIGTLGFLIREIRGKKEILVQAKIEPGNYHIIQIAPTCQATKSNSLRFHGGKEPPFSHLFTKEHPQIISSTLQSEQGSRFYNKKNRNTLAFASKSIKSPDSHKWMDINILLDLLSEDYTVNTDARSVLVCSPWKELIGRRPFSRFKTVFSKEMEQSYYQKISTPQFRQIKRDVSSIRHKKPYKKIISLKKLANWKITDYGVDNLQNNFFRVRHLKVIAKNREVPEWDQPIIDSYDKGRVNLICGRIKGVLHFNFSVITEPGLYNNAELSPITKDFIHYPNMRILKSVLQSDEGGRFYQDTSKYQIIDIGKVDKNIPGYWLNLAQIQHLALRSGWFTNEARSVISLLLGWL